MRRRTRIMLVGAALVLTAALSSTRRAAPPNVADQSRGTCCPWVAGLDGLCQKPGTNGPALNNDTNMRTLTNHP